MDSTTLLWLVIATFVLWKFVSFVRSSVSTTLNHAPRCDCMQCAPATPPPPAYTEPTRTIPEAPIRVYPRIAPQTSVPTNRAFQDEPKTNRYGELED